MVSHTGIWMVIQAYEPLATEDKFSNDEPRASDAILFSTIQY